MQFIAAQSMIFWKEESGQDLAEYALILTLIGLLTVSTLHNLAASIGAVFANVSSTFTSAL